MTIRSGFIVSLIAVPSLKNSGFETISNPKPIFLFANSSLIIVLHISPVPTGTVDLFMKIL